MSTPTMITVVGTVRIAGATVAGKLVFASSTLVRHGASDDVMIPQEIVATAGANGEISVQIPATNDPAFSPTGWTWEVRPHFPGWRESFSVAIPYDAAGATLQLSQLVEVPPDGDVQLYALVGHTHAGAGLGDVVGPSSSVTGRVAMFSGTTGKLILDSGVAASSLASIPIPPTFGRGTIVSGDVTIGSDASWTVVAGTSVALAAVVGDDIEFRAGFLSQHGSADYFDVVVVANGAIVRYASSGSGSPATANEGDPSMYPISGSALAGRSPFMSLVAASGDLFGGNITFALAHRGVGSSCKIFASAQYPLRWRIRNDH